MQQRKMGISKSAVSKHVSSLEARLGARLLNARPAAFPPTEIGLAYYDRARRVLNDAGEADALVTAMQSAPSGTLRVSIATDFGVNHVSPILGEFLRDYPDITVNMVLNNRYVELISKGSTWQSAWESWKTARSWPARSARPSAG